MKNKRVLMLEQILLPNAIEKLHKIGETHPDRQYWTNRIDEYKLELQEYQRQESLEHGAYHKWRNQEEIK